MNKILTTITVTLFLANTSFAWYDSSKSAVKPNSSREFSTE